VSAVTDMFAMFRGSDFNQPLTNWDVSSVTEMDEMFSDSPLQEDISAWCVLHLTTEPSNFSRDSQLSAQDRPKWGTCPGVPMIPSSLSPSDGADEIGRVLEFRWAGDDTASSYQIQVFEGTDPIVIDQEVTGATFTSEVPLKPNTMYHWRVRGINESDSPDGEPRTSEWSEIATFITGP